MNICEKNFGFTHKCGILAPVNSLPSKYGIGSLGKNAYKFVDFLDACKQTCWQVLPLNPTSYGDSPYQSPASLAGNPLLIDLELLAKDDLLSENDLAEAEDKDKRINYGKLFATRYPLLRKAFNKFVPNDDYSLFVSKNINWLDDYALFMALKTHYDYAPWTSWKPEHKIYARASACAAEFEQECNFWKWIQYEFRKQWDSLHAYAKKKGISIIGDMPIYVAHDSMDVWRNAKQFLLDDDLAPVVVAGCPPDAYAEDGQLWGNPIYNWEYMKKNDFSWWLERVGCALELYDVIRIDHFRGFASYYSVIAGEKTAVNGRWRNAPGKELFDAIQKKYPNAKIIAEDLGFITEDVRDLLKYTGFAGMKVLQFAFYDDDSEYLPRMFETDNCVVYSSTHDSDCTKSWYASLDKEARARFSRECPRKKGQTATSATVALALNSRANLAIIPLQDYLELSNEQGRINVPSKQTDNWSWCISPRYNTKHLREKITSVTLATHREK